jgi:hypothetical protein
MKRKIELTDLEENRPFLHLINAINTIEKEKDLQPVIELVNDIEAEKIAASKRYQIEKIKSELRSLGVLVGDSEPISIQVKAFLKKRRKRLTGIRAVKVGNFQENIFKNFKECIELDRKEVMDKADYVECTVIKTEIHWQYRRNKN